MAKPSLAITGCTNTYLSGTYNAQITNIALANVISAVNATGATGPTGGFGGNASSINGSLPGLGRFYFDGSGSIMGLAANSTANAPIFA